jgi:ribosome biogenesis protein NSA2
MNALFGKFYCKQHQYDYPGYIIADAVAVAFRPMGLRQKRANVTHPELGVTVQLPILSVKKNPQNPLYTQLGVLTRGTIIEVNVSELGLVTTSGKVVWGKWAQITSKPPRGGKIEET